MLLFATQLHATLAVIPAGRGRGLAKLIEGLWEGDPVAWGITVLVIVVAVVWGIVKSRSGE